MDVEWTCKRMRRKEGVREGRGVRREGVKTLRMKEVEGEGVRAVVCGME